MKEGLNEYDSYIDKDKRISFDIPNTKGEGAFTILIQDSDKRSLEALLQEELQSYSDGEMESLLGSKEEGIGHIYVGKIGKGIGILITGIILAVLLVFMAMASVILLFIFGIIYLVFWIWQIFNARKLAKKFNELVRTNGGIEP